jgi:hypothetical protein
MSEATPFLQRTSTLVGIVALVVTTAIGVLTYLATRPSDADRYHEEVSAFCASTRVGAPSLLSAITPDNAWDREALRRLVEQGVRRNEDYLRSWRAIEVPDELSVDHARYADTVTRWTKAMRGYARTLPTLPDDAFVDANPNQPPGDPTRIFVLSSSAQTQLARIGGADCVTPTP